MKRLPKELEVLGRKYKIKWNKSDREGICCPDKEEIQINPEAKNIPQTLLHETIHATIFSGGLFEALDNEKINEIICEQIARVIDENFEIKPRKKK